MPLVTAMLGHARARHAGATARPAVGGAGGRLPRCGLLAVALTCLLPALAPARSGAAPVEPVVVRAAVHPGFGRLVFEWSRAVTVERRQDGDRVILRFTRPLAADLSAAADRLRGYLRNIAAGADDHEVALLLAPAVELEIATYEERIVAVDLARRAPAAAQQVELRTGNHQGFGRIVLDWAQAVGFEATASGRSWRIVFDQAAEIDAEAIGERFRHLLDAADSARGAGRSELRLALKAGVRAEVFEVEGARVVIDLHAPVGPTAAATRASTIVPPAAVEDAQAALAEPAAGAASAPVEPDAAPADAGTPPAMPLTLRIGAAQDERGAALDFAWSRPLPAAFLIRAGYLWSVFAAPADEPVGLPSTFASPLPGHLGPGELIEASGGPALRFALRRPLAATVERAGAHWRVVFGPAATAPQAVRIERAEGPPRLRILAEEAVHLVRLTDPEVGDQLVVWPLLAAGRGQPSARRLVDLELLPTAQGLAWRARSDDLRVQTSENALELVASGGLRLAAARPPEETAATLPDPGHPPATPAPRAVAGLGQGRRSPGGRSGGGDRSAVAGAARSRRSRPAPSSERTEQAGPATPEHQPLPAGEAHRPLDPTGPAAAAGREADDRPLDLARFAQASPDRNALQQRIAQAPPAERSLARLELARWFLARAMAPEARAVLDVLGEADRGPAAGGHQRVRQRLAAAAALLMGALDDAAAVLEDPALDADVEVALWRAALAAAREDWPRGARELDRAKVMLTHYPAALQLRLGLPAAQAAIEAGNHDLAAPVLSALAKLELTPGERARVAFYDGLALARQGALERAEEIWRGLEGSVDHDSRIKAAYARVQLLLDAGRLGPDEAAARLSPARALWRGHPWEARMLAGLAELYRQSGDRAAAIRTWHDLLTEFPAWPDAAGIDRAMRAAFEEALLQGEATGVMRAYALYRDFPRSWWPR